MMRFLDLDLDFFLNEEAYCREYSDRRLGPEYKPWCVIKVRQFLENRCGILPHSKIPGRTLESHDRILDFWRTLIKSNRIKIPFEVVHIDAHPDILITDGIHITSQFIYVDSIRSLEVLRKEQVDPGNYLTFAIVYGWIGLLVWINLHNQLNDLPVWNGDARTKLNQLKNLEIGSPSTIGLTVVERERIVPFKILPWRKFKTSEPFDYIALSRSPNSTPPESDKLISIIEEYIKQI